MRNFCPTPRALLLSLALLGARGAQAQKPEPDGIGAWYIYFADYGISEKWSIHHETQLHLYEPHRDFNRFVVRVGANYTLRPGLIGSAVYHYSYSDPTFAEEGAVNRLQEHRLMEQLVYRYRVFRWGISHRLRTEQRFFDRDGVHSTAQRIRYRLLLSHPLAGPFYAAADGEVLTEWQDGFSTSFRLTGSLGAYLNPQMRLQVGYTRFYLPGGGRDEKVRVLLLFNPALGKKIVQP